MSFPDRLQEASDLDQERGAMGAAELASKIPQVRKVLDRAFETP